ncbi:hypothetical protein HY798_00620 [Candidatus Falkowbacteria bacterium]|nr:hypothetical protein [Candidatus Falkowbacteria bacterium]
MVRKIRKQNKKEVEVSLGTVIDGFMKGIGGLLGLAAKLEEEGRDEYAEQGEINLNPALIPAIIFPVSSRESEAASAS